MNPTTSNAAALPDRPRTANVHPVIAGTARTVYDRMPHEERHRITPLLPSVIGTADTRQDETERRVLTVRLITWCARRVAHLNDHELVTAALEAAEAWAAGPGPATARAAAGAADALYDLLCMRGDLTGFFAIDYAVAHAAYDAAAAAANFASPYAAIAGGSTAVDAVAIEDLPAHLSGLIEEHARLTGT